jgi:hypothetical protein
MRKRKLFLCENGGFATIFALKQKKTSPRLRCTSGATIAK